eukprot:GDKH01029241.1.p2 GENE.GDKH01029241.1~~GDKH01029241.1.p2  ORF type:complete len:89 (+),score=5.07 GDKH01029241.1:121-387(+)
MGFFIPAVLLGSLGAGTVQVQKNSSYEGMLAREQYTPIFGFWWGMGVGMFFGVWLGATFAPSVSEVWKWIDLFWGGGSSNTDDREPSR